MHWWSIIGFKRVLCSTMHRIDTATVDAKLAQKLAGIAHDLLFQVFVYVQKAYGFLDQEW